MLPKKLTSRVRQTCYPYFLTQDDVTTSTFISPNESDLVRQLHNLFDASSDNFQRQSSPPQSHGFPSSEVIKLFELDPNKSNNANRSTQNWKDLLSEYLKEEPFSYSKAKMRIKHGSLERFSSEDLCTFYRYNDLLRKTKKIEDQNLWLLLERIKTCVFQLPDYRVILISTDLAQIALTFIFSSVSELRFDKCKKLLEKLENIEKSIAEMLQRDEGFDHSDVSVGPSSHGEIFFMNSMASSNNITLKDIAESKESATPESRRTSILWAKPNSLKDDGEIKSELKEVSIIANLLKYTIARVGHLLHYDRLSNPVSEIFTKKIEHEPFKPLSPSLRIMKHQENKSHDGTPLGSSEKSALTPKRLMKRSSLNLTEDNFKDSKILKNYFYTAHSVLNDFEPEIHEKRVEQLRKFAKWKTAKWIKKSKRLRLEKKYLEQTIVCRICAQEIKAVILKEHSELCRKQGEITKSQEIMDKKFSEIIHKAQIKSKHVHTSIVLLSKSYHKLKEKPESPPLEGRPSRGMTICNSKMVRNANPQPSTSEIYAPIPERSRGWSGNFIRTQNTLKNFEKQFAEETALNFSFSNAQNSKNNDLQDLSFNMEEENSHIPETMSSSAVLPQLPRLLKKQSEPFRILIEKKKAKSPPLGKKSPPPRGSFGSKQKKKTKQKKTRVNNDTNCNFYSDPDRSDGDSGDSSDSKESVDSVMSSDVAFNGRYLGFPLSKSPSYVSPERSPSEHDDFRGHSGLLISPNVKKSRFATQVPKTHFQEEIEEATQPEKANDFVERMSEVLSEAPSEFNNLHEDFSFSPQLDEDPPLFRTASMGFSLSGFRRSLDPRHLEEKPVPEILKLKADVIKKRNIKEAYDFIVTKGKVLLNEGIYQKKMEVVHENIADELNNMVSKVEDSELNKVSEEFLNLAKNRIKYKRDLQETLQSIANLTANGKTNLIPSRKNSIDLRRNSLPFRKRPSGLKLSISSTSRKFDDCESPVLPSPLKLRSHVTRREFASEDLMKHHPEIETTHHFKSIDLLTVPKSNEKFSFSMSSYIEDVDQSINQLASKYLVTKEDEKSVPRKFTELTNSPIKSCANESDGEATETHKKEFQQKSVKIYDFQERETPERFDYSTEENKQVKESEEEYGKFEDERFSSSTREFKPSPPQIYLWAAKNTSSDNRQDLTPKESNSSFGSPKALAFIPLSSSSSKRTFTKTKTLHLDKVPNESEDSDGDESDDFPTRKNISQIIRSRAVSKRQTCIIPQTRVEPILQAEVEAEVEVEVEQTKLTKKKKTAKVKSLTLDSRNSGNKGGNSPIRKTKKNPNQNPTKKPEEPLSFAAQVQAVTHVEDIQNQEASIENSFDNADMESEEYMSSLEFDFADNDRGYYSDGCLKNVEVTFPIQPRIGIKDFKPIKMISKGAFGRVWLMKRKVTHDYYAIKIVDLAEKGMKNSNELNNLKNENRVFGRAEKDFVVRALFTFTHETFICFAMEYMVGGDFGDILVKYGCLDEDTAKFYIAEIVLALEYLHSLGVIHRDLKPDNILIDKNGHAKLTDFGLSEVGLTHKIKANATLVNLDEPYIFQKIEAINQLCQASDDDNSESSSESEDVSYILHNGKPNKHKNELNTSLHNSRKVSEDFDLQPHPLKNVTIPARRHSKIGAPRMVGTPDYMPPEIIMGLSVKNYSIDWWSLGVLLFEFLCGVPPFNDETPDKIFENIQNLKIPWDQIEIGYGENCLSPEAADLIKQLLTADYTKRLGADGAWQIKEHKFFQGIDWENLRKQTAPIVPEKKGEGDTDNFMRMESKIMDKERESPFVHLGEDAESFQDKQIAKKLLDATSHQFNQSNYAALYSDNLKYLEEKMMEHEKALQEVGEEDKKDPVFDMFEELIDEKNC